MTNPKDYVVRGDASIDDVDLDVEVVTVKGRRLTEAGAEQLAQETLAEARLRNLIPGRKSLSEGSTHSPRVQFRVPKAVAIEAQNRARAEGKSLSELAREALLRYLAS
ncbi:MAG: DNA-binding protein [Mycobacteriales bacterium]